MWIIRPIMIVGLLSIAVLVSFLSTHRTPEAHRFPELVLGVDAFSPPSPPVCVALPGFELSNAEKEEMIRAIVLPHKWTSENGWSLGGVLHAIRLLRFVESVTPDNSRLFHELVALLTSQRMIDATFNVGDPLIVDTIDGFNYRKGTGSVDTLQAHVDNVVADLGELGFSAKQPVVSRRGSQTVIDCLNDSMRRDSADRELEWTVIALCAYLHQSRQWQTRRGHVLSMNLLANRLLDKRIGVGPCSGTHREYALCRLIARSRATRGFLSTNISDKIAFELQTVSRQLADSLAPDGYWDIDWAGMNLRDTRGELQVLTDRLYVTGHILEWMSLCPTDLRITDKQLLRAAKWCRAQLLLRRELFELDYIAATHATRGLLQLATVPRRGKERSNDLHND